MEADPALHRTPLFDLHRELGAKMAPFAGYAMPVRYPAGIVAEHCHTRDDASLFDVSHMGQLRVGGGDAAAALESLTPADLRNLAPFRQRYCLLTNEAGGVEDDVMATRRADGFLLVVNAARADEDLSRLRRALADRVEIEALKDRALLAVQGPRAAARLEPLCPGIGGLAFMGGADFVVAGKPCFVTRSGYTGEDGFEISVAAVAAEALARALLEAGGVAPAGLGARDSLRLEAGLCLYGHDLDAATTPVEAGLAWTIPASRRAGGTNPGGFPGAQVILGQLRDGAARYRVGIEPAGRAPVRAGAELLDAGERAVGVVTSGGFGPTLKRPVAMGYVEARRRAPGTVLRARVRDRLLEARVRALPFVAHRYVRAPSPRRPRSPSIL